MQLREETLTLIDGPSSAMIAVVGRASRPLVSRVWGAELVSATETPFRIETTGRGRFRLDVSRPIELIDAVAR